MFDTTAHSCGLIRAIILIIRRIVNIAAVRQAFFHRYAMPSIIMCVLDVYVQWSVHTCTVNVVVEWRRLAAICVNVYVQVRVYLMRSSRPARCKARARAVVITCTVKEESNALPVVIGRRR